MTINNILINLINDPYNDLLNYNLAYEYEKINQTASALSYYLRCSEFTKNNNLSYECLLRMSNCLSLQGDRENKELACIEHSISICPDRPEAYYIISLYYSFRKKWLKSYMYSCIGINYIHNNYPKLINNLKYSHDYQLLFQKAYSGYNKGKINESKKIYFNLLNNYQLTNEYKNLITNNLNKFPEPMSNPKICYQSKLSNIKYKFNNIEKIKKNYSQIYQDIFVLIITNGKENGTYLEIGSGDPIYGNNTYLLEKDFKWKGLSIDINNFYKNKFIEKRLNNFICENALNINYCELLLNNKEIFENNIIDYLQIDCDPCENSYEILLKIPFDKYQFKIITFEHDYYNDKNQIIRQKSRDYLLNKGYQLIAGNISPNDFNNPFEDWWINPKLININENLIDIDKEYLYGEKYLFK